MISKMNEEQMMQEYQKSLEKYPNVKKHKYPEKLFSSITLIQALGEINNNQKRYNNNYDNKIEVG
jgi:hypothetical protein